MPERNETPLSQRALAGVPPRTPMYLEGLNTPQREAVEALEGPVLMLAGAGTGKTRALTARIAHLIATGTARPNEILAVTFTNKAAREMRERVGNILGETVEGMPWLGTFHAIGVRFLRRHAELVGLKSNFTILDTDDQLRLLKQLIRAANLDEKRWPPRAFAGIIDSWKNRAWRPDMIPAEDAGLFSNRGTELYSAYQERLRTLNACDFGDLLLHVVTIFQQNPDVLSQYQRWLRFILVDEYQDTNVAQYLLLRLLAQGHQNLCCVGDDDQSIYGWRGAEVGNILRFERDFPGARVIRLEQNYRSTPHILAAAGGVIAANEGRLGKTLWTERSEGQKVHLIGHWDGEEEARWIGEEIEALERGARGMDPVSRNDMAILVRASHQMRAFEDRFLSIGLPYRVVGGARFYERLEIRDAMAYFRLAVSPTDDLAFERIVNTPKRGLGEKAQQTIQKCARDAGVSLVQGAAIALRDDLIRGKGAGSLRMLLEQLASWHDIVRRTEQGFSVDQDDIVIDEEEFVGNVGFDAQAPNPRDRGAQGAGGQQRHVELAGEMLDASGYTAMWQNEKTPEAEGRLENLKELLKALEQFENLQGFLEHVALIMDNESEDTTEKVTIMTLHAAKGLEFPVVFLPGWEDGLFPSQRSLDESGLKGLEEERRLAYVGITRAEQFCVISFASNRRVFGQWQSQLPSRFIDELPADHVEVLTQPGLYGNATVKRAAPMGDSELEAQAMRADVYNAPGWRRMQTRSKRAPVAISPSSQGQEFHFSEGERVFNQKFGTGTVLAIDGDKLIVAFDRGGQKKIISRFLTPADGMDDTPF